MTTHGDLSRRKLAAGLGGAVLAIAGFSNASARTDVTAKSGAPPPVRGLHLRFATDASSKIVISWHALERVCR